MTAPILIMQALYGPTLKELEATWPHKRLWEAADGPALMREMAADCKVVVTTGARGMKAAEMDLLPKLELISCFGVGVDAIDVAHARSRRIAVTNTPDVLTEDVADMAVSLLLATVRRIAFGDRFVRTGRWLREGPALTMSMQKRKVGIIGLGRIGQSIATRCAAFNTEIAYHGPRRKADSPYQYFDSAVKMAQWADFIVAACPGGPATAGIVSREVLTALGPEGVFVNISRGSVVDQPALVELLVSGKLGGAGLDVFNNEPNVPQGLMALDNVVLQPHQGSGTHTTRTAMGRLTIDNVAAWEAGKPLLTPV